MPVLQQRHFEKKNLCTSRPCADSPQRISASLHEVCEEASHLRLQNLKLNSGTICITKSCTARWVRKVNTSTSQLTGQEESIKKTYLADHFLTNKSRSQFGRICDQDYGHLSVTSPWGSKTNNDKKRRRNVNAIPDPAPPALRPVASEACANKFTWLLFPAR